MRVVFGTPTLDKSVCSEYLVSLIATINLLNQHGIQSDLAMIGGDCFIAKARNNIVTDFMEKDADTLFFVDADQGWDAADVLRIVLDPHELVAGVPPKKTDDGGQFAHVFLDHDADLQCYLEGGLMRAKACGTGFMRLKKSAVEKYIDAYPEIYQPGDGSTLKYHYNLFEAKIIDGQFWGEDLHFCNRWTALGEHCWIDPQCKFQHVGRKAWQGSYYEFLCKTAKVTTQPLRLAA